MSVLVVGLSHNSAPVSVLEKVARDSEGTFKLIRDVADNEHVVEATVLSTASTAASRRSPG
jgi:glutamyl-tRNA reductase